MGHRRKATDVFAFAGWQFIGTDPFYVGFGTDIPVYVGQPFSFHVRAVRDVR